MPVPSDRVLPSGEDGRVKALHLHLGVAEEPTRGDDDRLGLHVGDGTVDVRLYADGTLDAILILRKDGIDPGVE